MDKKIVKEYQELLREETSKGYWKHFEGRKKFTEPIVFAILSVFLTLFGLFIVNGAVTMNEVWVAIIPTIGVPLIWAFIIWLKSRADAHVKIYSDKKSEAYLLTWADIEIEEFIFPEESGLGIGLKVVSHKTKDWVITDAKAEITAIKRAGESIGRVVSSRLGWAIGMDTVFSILWGETTLYSEDPQLLLIANSNGSEGWIEAQDENRQSAPYKLDNNVSYQITVDMMAQCYDLGYPLVRCAVICNIAFNHIEGKFKYKILEIDKYTSGRNIITERRKPS